MWVPDRALTSAPALQPGLGLPRLHILVVDDEDATRTFLAEALTRDGHDVVLAGSGEEALGKIRRGKFDVVLTDLTMPGMSGLKLCSTTRSMRPHTAIILMTSTGTTETAVEAMRAGADDFLTKPFALDRLRDQLQRVTDAHRGHRSSRVQQTRVREEADSLRARSLRAERDLAEAQGALAAYRSNLEKRSHDLNFVRRMTAMLSHSSESETMLADLAKMIADRFGALAVRIEADLGDGVQTIESGEDPTSAAVLNSMGVDLLQAASRNTDAVVVDSVLGKNQPLQVMAASVRLAERDLGAMFLVREPQDEDDARGDRFLFALLPQALSVSLSAEIHRRSARLSAIRVSEGILDALETRGTLYRGHAKRAARVATVIAEQLGLSTREIRFISLAARLHDVGKVSLPDGVLQRAGPLTEAERRVLQMHPVVGARILAPFSEAALFVRHHCERPDGLGYPDGLRGDEIPLGAGIVGLAGAYNAIINPRPYKSSRSRREALDEIVSHRGTQFVPSAVDALIAAPREQL